MNNKRTNEALGRASVDEYLNHDKHPVVVVLDDIRSLSNVGSIFRTADAFNVESVALCGITGTPPHRDIQRTALGATESVEWTHEEDITIFLLKKREEGYKLLAVEQCDDSIDPKSIEDSVFPCCVILGNEVNGVSQDVIELCDAVIEIPQQGTKHSLNVTIAGGIVLWELFKRNSG